MPKPRPPIPPPPEPGKHRKHQGRINRNPEHWNATEYPWEMIQLPDVVLEHLHRFRMLSGAQVARLAFRATATGDPRVSRRAMQKAANEMCLERLKTLGYAELMPVYVTPADGPVERREVNLLSRRGSDMVRGWHKAEGRAWSQRSAGTVRDYRWSTINELYWIIDAATAIVADAALWDVGLVEWLDKFDTAGKGRGKPGEKRKEVPFPFVEPDGYLKLRYGGVDLPLFIESDRDTESSDSPAANSWRTKMGRYAQLMAWWDETYPLSVKPLVLTVTTTPERVDSLLPVTRKAGNLGSYWFTTEDRIAAPKLRDLKGLASEERRAVIEAEAFPDALGAIWRVPHEPGYRSLLDHLTRPRRRAA